MPLLKLVKDFLADTRAGLSVETVIIMPLLWWGYMGMFVLFEGYRSISANNRASYTISDMLSRETNSITPAYLQGLNKMVDILTQSPHRTVLRVSVVSYDEDDDEHELEWSYSTPGQNKITDGELNSKLVPYLPPMPDAAQVIVVETWMAFVPVLNVGIAPKYFESLTTIRPRFAGQLKFNP